jgi:hypothetical protein
MLQQRGGGCSNYGQFAVTKLSFRRVAVQVKVLLRNLASLQVSDGRASKADMNRVVKRRKRVGNAKAGRTQGFGAC